MGQGALLMANILNIGSVAIYKKNEISGEYEYTALYDLLDYLSEDGSINIDSNINFGSSFDIIGNHLFIGCPYMEPLNDDDKTEWKNKSIGSVYVFDLTDGSLLQTITPDNTPGEFSFAGQTNYVVRGHNFGYELSAGDDFIVIGAPGYSTNNGPTLTNKSGRAYMYKYNGSEYELSYTFVPTKDIDRNRFGNYICVNDNEVIIGSAPSANAPTSGYVKYYEINTDRDGLINTITLSNTHVGTICDIKINDGQIAIGTPYNDTIRIFKIDTNIANLTHTISDRLTAGFGVGKSIEFDNGHVISGCPDGYKKLGIALRFTNIGQKYTLI